LSTVHPDRVKTVADVAAALEETAEWTSQWGSDPKHTSARANTWFHDHDINILHWAPSSPDMNIIEHAWEQLHRQVCAREVLPQN
jgi:hypothetical protein